MKERIKVMGKVINGDALTELKKLPDESVDMCVTSPPYYGLRDYGTGKWIGGDPNCPHKRLSKYSDRITTGHKQKDLIGMVGDAIYKTVCPLCGAVREDNQIGLEETPDIYIYILTQVFHEVRRVLKPQGTLWLNIGDSYWGSGSRGYDFTGKWNETSEIQSNSKGTENLSALPKLVGQRDGYKNKDLIGIPWMLAFALRNDGWYLRQDIIWQKPNPMPESVTDRCSKSHEYIFLFS
jgi:site-specific DNA-methyltransferase (cytosine-N4-specific)